MTKQEQKKANIEERNDPRAEKEVDISFTATEPSPHNFFPGITRDPATNGLFLATDRPLPAGTRLHLSFITETRRVESHAEVCWQHKSGNGATPEAKLRLLDITAEDRDLIEFYIREKK